MNETRHVRLVTREQKWIEGTIQWHSDCSWPTEVVHNNRVYRGGLHTAGRFGVYEESYVVQVSVSHSSK